MKRKIPIFLFVASTLLFVLLLVLSVDFGIACKDFRVETSGEILGGIILISVYAAAILIISVLGLCCSIPGAILASQQSIRICLDIEVAAFSIGMIFAVFQLFL